MNPVQLRYHAFLQKPHLAFRLHFLPDVNLRSVIFSVLVEHFLDRKCLEAHSERYGWKIFMSLGYSEYLMPVGVRVKAALRGTNQGDGIYCRFLLPTF